MVRYTEKLLEKGEERKRLTKQLAVLVGTVANDIAQALPVGTEPKFTLRGFSGPVEKVLYEKEAHWHGLRIVKVESNIGEKKFLALDGKFVFVPDKEPGSSFCLDNDPRAKVRVASDEEYLRFANFIPEIASAFERKADELNKELREAFRRLKEIASTEAGEL